jgi:hypothetical protein
MLGAAIPVSNRFHVGKRVYYDLDLNYVNHGGSPVLERSWFYAATGAATFSYCAAPTGVVVFSVSISSASACACSFICSVSVSMASSL